MFLFDTQSRTLRELKPIDNQTFRFYCCGPTVYGPAHIGNFRTFVLQDVFRRVLELGGIPTKHVRNLTDVDDKTIRDSQKSGLSLDEFTAKWTKKFHRDCLALNCLAPHVEPSAVAHIPHQIRMVETLIEKGHAYVSEDGSVYFKIASFPEYGRLSHLENREIELGKTANTRSTSDEYEKDSLADFVLWKSRRPEDGTNFWASPWGEGRPGWHLECSAMILEYLGTDFDLHSGGVDLVFPHHENEIAQSRCACHGNFAAHWFHITHLLVDGGKMSKSLGNMYTLSDLEGMGYQPELVRYSLVSGYYRRPMNFTLSSLSDAKVALGRLARFEEQLRAQAGTDLPQDVDFEKTTTTTETIEFFVNAWKSLLDDLNTPEALGHVFSEMKVLRANELSPKNAARAWHDFAFILKAFGLKLLPPQQENSLQVPAEICELAEHRWRAKAERDWTRADSLREQLTLAGWQIKDNKDGYEILPL